MIRLSSYHLTNEARPSSFHRRRVHTDQIRPVSERFPVNVRVHETLLAERRSPEGKRVRLGDTGVRALLFLSAVTRKIYLS